MSLQKLRTKFEEWWNSLVVDQSDIICNQLSSQVHLRHISQPSSLGCGDSNNGNARSEKLQQWWDGLRHNSTPVLNAAAQGIQSDMALRSSPKRGSRMAEMPVMRRPLKRNSHQSNLRAKANSIQYLYLHDAKDANSISSEEATCSSIVHVKRPRRCCGCRRKKSEIFHLSEELTTLLRRHG